MLKLMEAKRLNLAVLLSGRGSNFLALLRTSLSNELNAAITVAITDNPDAAGYQKALDAGITAYVIQREHFQSKAEFEQQIIHKLQEANTDIVILAGFMRIIGKTLIQAYPNRILNIHPSLLPAFPGLNAQKQALDYGVRYSGCTVHLVDEGMDTGPIIMQSVVPVLPQDTEETLSERILEAEHKLYAQTVQFFAEGRVYLQGRKVYIQE
jgi:phosphoribosylglycinamide formyltransferase-1